MTRRLLAALLLAFAEPAGAQNTTIDLGGTSWQLVKFQGSDDTTLTPDDRAKYTITFASGSSVSTRIDCNRGGGTWKSSGPNQLQFGPLALTRAMCAPAPLNNRLVQDWQLVRSYTFKDGHLLLSVAAADGGIYEFEPMGGSRSTTPQSPVASKGPVEFECTQAGSGHDTLIATFYHTNPAMVLIERGNHTRPAFQVLAADGAKYEGQDILFWEARGEAMVTWSGTELKCKPRY